MAYNRKMRKFEGTCYIPGEQLAMMAKYYRGANLNLNLTLFEDDLASMQETLDQACWCSKLNEVDRMKMGHMKGNEWRMQHDHCLQNGKQNPTGSNPMALPALTQRSKSTVGKVERGTSALSLYDREVLLGRGREGYDPRYRRGDDVEIRNRRNPGELHRVYYNAPPKGDYGPLDFQQNSRRPCRDMRGIPDRRYEMESETVVSSVPEMPTEIRCAVCNVETCLVCKNHLYSPVCQCKCLVANAGLCNKCNQTPCEEDEQTAREGGIQKMDMSSMMLTLMMSSMFKQSQTPGSVCCCKHTKDDSDSSSTDSSDAKVHKVYLYDCEGAKMNKKSKKKTGKPTSSSGSSSCDCCKCAGKQKKTTKKGEGTKTSDDDSEGSERKPHKKNTREDKSDKRKGSKDSRKSKGGDENSETELETKSSIGNARKSRAETRKSLKGSTDESKKSSKSSENMKAKNVTSMNRKSTTLSKIRGSKAQSIDSRNVQFCKPEKTSPLKNEEMSSSELDKPRNCDGSRQKSPPEDKTKDALISDTQANVPDMDSSKHLKNNGDTEGIQEESSTSFNMREFIVSLPKIQSHLQNLVSKLNQMDVIRNQLPHPPIDPSVVNSQRLGEFQLRQGVPLVRQEPPGIDRDQVTSHSQGKRGSDISTGYNPCDQPNMPPTISPGSSKEGPKVCTPFNLPNTYQSTAIKFDYGPAPLVNSPTDFHDISTMTEREENPKQTKSILNFPPDGNSSVRYTMGNTGNPSSQSGNITNNGFGGLVNATLESNKISIATEREGNPKQTKAIFKTPTDCNFSTKYLIGNNGNSSFQSRNSANLGSGVLQGVLQNNVASRTVQERASQPELGAANDGCARGFSDLSTDLEIIEVPQSAGSCKESIVHNARNEEGETIFHSYQRESIPESSDPDLTDYGSFPDEKYFLPPQAPSIPKAIIRQEPKIARGTDFLKKDFKFSVVEKTGKPCSSVPKVLNNLRSTTRNTGCVPKLATRSKFKAKQKNTLALGKLIEGCKLKQNSGFRGVRSKNDGYGAALLQKTGMHVLEQGVGPGKFRRSKSDSSLERTIGDQYEKRSVRPKSPKTSDGRRDLKMMASIGKSNDPIPLKKKRSNSPISKGMKNASSFQKTSLQLKKINLNIQPGPGSGPAGREDCSDSILKMSDAFVQRQVGCQSYMVSSVELKAVSNDGSSTEILKMVHASNSQTNETRESSGVPQTGHNSDLDIIPLLPLSSTTPCSDSKGENPSSSVEGDPAPLGGASKNTPAFLKKSLIQVEQLKRAHETIRSMIKNVNDVIAHIDSDSKIGIRSKTFNEDRERQNYYVHVEDEEKRRRNEEKRPDRKNEGLVESRFTRAASGRSSDKQCEGVQEMFASVNRVVNAVLTPSEQSSSAQDPPCLSGTATSSRAHRDYYVLNSESTSTAFTESLRRSLENDTSRSVPLATQQRPCDSPHRPHSTRPLKRRSWFPPK